jgi:hypothetical protein
VGWWLGDKEELAVAWKKPVAHWVAWWKMVCAARRGADAGPVGRGSAWVNGVGAHFQRALR